MCNCTNLYDVYNNNCLVLYSYHATIRYIFIMAIFKPRLFCSHATSHKADWILTTHCCLLYLARLYAHVFSLMKVLEMVHSRFRLLENYFAIALFFVLRLLSLHTCLSLFSHACSCWLTRSIYLYRVYCVHIVLVAFTFIAISLSISFTLMIFLLVAFAYCFHVKWPFA